MQLTDRHHEGSGDEHRLNYPTILLGVLVNAAFAAIVSSLLSGVAVTALGGVVYLALVIFLTRRVGHWYEFLGRSISAGAPAGFLVLGLGGLVATEFARVAGSGDATLLSLSLVYMLLGGTVLGVYLALGLTALAAGGVRRVWLPVATTLIVPAVMVATSSFIRLDLTGATYVSLAPFALFFVYATVAWPQVRAQWNGLLEEVRDKEREDESGREQVSTSKARDDQEGKLAAAKTVLKEKLATELKGVGVALSGGGHRAALFDLGVLLYLVRAGKHRDVAQISSVSGGSMTNAYVARSVNFRTCGVMDFDRVAGRLARQLADKGTLFAYWQSRAYVLGLFVTAVLTVVAFGFWIRRPQWLPETWLVPAGAISALLFLGYSALQRGAVCRWAFRKSLFTSNGRPVQLSDLSAPPIHAFCATELQTGSGAYFFKAPFIVTREGGLAIEYFPTMVSEGFQTTIHDFELATAVQASASLPGAFPPVKLSVRGWMGITRRKTAQTWERLPADYMLLVDGGVRDNLGVEWFLRSTAAVTPLLIVVNGAANRVRGRAARVSAPWLGDLTALLLVKDLPYNFREQNRRQELLSRFLRCYRGQTDDIAGAIAHIEESPCDLAEAVDRTGVAQEAFDSWLVTPEDERVVEALRQRSDFDAVRVRAADVLAHLEQAEDVEALRAAKVKVARDDVGRELASRAWASILVPEEWGRRAYRNSTIPTTLSKLGRSAAAELMRHSFALAMAKLHILFDFPLCALPSIDELQRMMDVE